MVFFVFVFFIFVLKVYLRSGGVISIEIVMNISVVVINFGVLVEGIVLLWIVIMRLMSVILVFGMEFMFIWSDI